MAARADAGPAAQRGEALLAWYARVARPLPWRSTRDPYAILVSEVMLQQTQAARVVPYWTAWMARWPAPSSLAAAPVADVLGQWRGLGYNRRALALRAAAGIVAANGWPEDLTALPGVGAYTAAAVASFAWDRPVPAVDTNTRRVLSRWRGRELSLRDAGVAGRREQAAVAGMASPAIVADGSSRPASANRPSPAASWNQAMMELGATTCRARDADCPACPVAAWCASAGRVVVAPRAPGGTRKRFEDTDRWARGRVLAALIEGGLLPELDPIRRERVLAGLARDGLIRLTADGAPVLP